MRELSPAQRGAMRRGAFPPDPNNDRIGMNFCQIIDESIPPSREKNAPPRPSRPTVAPLKLETSRDRTKTN